MSKQKFGTLPKKGNSPKSGGSKMGSEITEKRAITLDILNDSSKGIDLKRFDRLFRKENNIVGLMDKKQENKFADEIIVYLDNKIQELPSEEIGLDTFTELQEEWAQEEKSNVIIERTTKEGKKYLCYCKMNLRIPDIIDGRYIFTVISGLLINEKEIKGRRVDDTTENRVLDIVKGETKFIVDNKVYKIV